MPLVSHAPLGSSTPECHCVRGGASGCRLRNASGWRPRMLTSGDAGASVNLSQQSPRLCVCASGSKHFSSVQNANALHGSEPNGPAGGRGRRRSQRALGEALERSAARACAGRRGAALRTVVFGHVLPARLCALLDRLLGVADAPAHRDAVVV